MSEQEVQELLRAALESHEPYDDEASVVGAGPVVTQTFEELGVLTSDAGFVIRLADGSEFQVTIVKSRAGY